MVEYKNQLKRNGERRNYHMGRDRKTLRPGGTATRAQVAAMLKRYLERDIYSEK